MSSSWSSLWPSLSLSSSLSSSSCPATMYSYLRLENKRECWGLGTYFRGGAKCVPTPQVDGSHSFSFSSPPPSKGDSHGPPAKTWLGAWNAVGTFAGLACWLRHGRFMSRFSHILNDGWFNGMDLRTGIRNLRSESFKEMTLFLTLGLWEFLSFDYPLFVEKYKDRSLTWSGEFAPMWGKDL